jgi:asparagine synthase (glutamine-hydrolysing)
MNSPGFNLDEIKELFPSLRSEFRINDEAHQYRQHLTTNFGKYKKWQYVDAHTIMPDDNLVYVDRMSMANSLEVRVPLLDHNIVEFAFSLSDSHSIKGSNQKLILRNFLEGRGLGHLLDVSKQGFSSPINMFFPVENMLEMLNESRLVNDGLMSSKALSKHIAFNNSYKIWLMTVLEIWYRKWIH